ncbi:MAG: ArsR family transcriptional regulator [Pseudobacteriovorax sp.]|nr:ArsR family transcriptional regulator [Pseudobacteriovorax sp.]
MQVTPPIPELEEIAQQIGEFMEYWGYKKVHGQIWCYLYLSKTPLDAGQLMNQLNISKALVSISLKELVQHGVVVEVGKSQRGTKTYTAIEDVTRPILDTLRRREQRMVSRIVGAYRNLSRLPTEELDSSGIDRKKLALLGRFIKLVDFSLNSIVKHKWLGFNDIFSFTSKVFAGNPAETKRPNESHESSEIGN